jgi:YidC/Oxa1 family membrane protein insertase
LIRPSVEVSKTHHLFVGAKEIKTLDMYEEKLKVQHFDLAIDFGCLYILTKPLLYALAYTKDLVGNMGLGIILITLLIKLFLFPLANRSYRSMNRMNIIQPKIQELRKKYEGDNAKFGQAVSEIYKKEGVNPLGGCLPVLLQSPVLFALYKVLYISMEMRQAPFIWWIRDLSLPDPSTILNLFGLIPVNLPGFLQIGIWPLLMGISMLLQQRMSPAPTDPSQAKMMLIMPVMFTFMFAQLPSGLVIYWTFSNILGIAQQYIIQRLDRDRRSKEDSAEKKAKTKKS